MGLTPRSVVEIPERGDGRMSRLHEIIEECRTSIHDLSRVSSPPRFNMPFELGLASAFKHRNPNHHIIVLESKPYRLQQTLSDYNGYDPIIHKGSRIRLLMAILDLFDATSDPDPKSVHKVRNGLNVAAVKIKKDYRQELITTPGVYKQIVLAAMNLALNEGLLRIN